MRFTLGVSGIHVEPGRMSWQLGHDSDGRPGKPMRERALELAAPFVQRTVRELLRNTDGYRLLVQRRAQVEEAELQLAEAEREVAALEKERQAALNEGQAKLGSQYIDRLSAAAVKKGAAERQLADARKLLPDAYHAAKGSLFEVTRGTFRDPKLWERAHELVAEINARIADLSGELAMTVYCMHFAEVPATVAEMVRGADFLGPDPLAPPPCPNEGKKMVATQSGMTFVDPSSDAWRLHQWAATGTPPAGQGAPAAVR